jgi:glutaminase
MEQLINEIYRDTVHINDGKVADYIPQLAEVNPEMYGVAFCDLNGNIYSVGDSDNNFSLQSVVKPLTYCLARHQESTVPGAPSIHQHVGFEPSGMAFNAFVLNREGLPHNPLINSGAMMTTSLIATDQEPSARFEAVHKFICKMSGFGGHAIGFDNSIFLSEKVHADRNISLAYYMRENKAFPGAPTQSELTGHLELYFQTCSLTATCRTVAAIAATLANHGKSPISGEEVLAPEIIMDTLSIMYMCGMYDFSGQFAFNIGLPAKSGVCGAIMLVIPNVGGICTWSPRLDEIGNSVRGLAFCNEFAKRTKNLHHIFRTMSTAGSGSKQEEEDTTEQELNNIKSMETFTHRIIHACSVNDVEMLMKLIDHGVKKFRRKKSGDTRGEKETVEEVTKRLVDCADYDYRSCVHLAAAEGHEAALHFLINNGANPHPKDRWGNTPLHEVRKAMLHLDKKHENEDYIPTKEEGQLREHYKAIFFLLSAYENPHILDDEAHFDLSRTRSDSSTSRATVLDEWAALSHSTSIEHLPDLMAAASAVRENGSSTNLNLNLNLSTIPESKTPPDSTGSNGSPRSPTRTVVITPAAGAAADASAGAAGGDGGVDRVQPPTPPSRTSAGSPAFQVGLVDSSSPDIEK